MSIRVGLKTGDLQHSAHKVVRVSSKSPIVARSSGKEQQFGPDSELLISARDGSLTIAGVKFGSVAKLSVLRSGIITFASDATGESSRKPRTSYRGVLELSARGNVIMVVLETDIESYVQGVLQSEVPSYFKLEAMKAQAVLARTYGIRPRLSHVSDGYDVCDSFLHCQAFYGLRNLTPLQNQAIASTKHQILMFENKPALALFSACAGGHTENYENCFSDPVTGAFPPSPIPYLRGRPEGTLPKGFPSESALRALFAEPNPNTVDAWSKNSFRWRVTFSADALEAHMHHIIEKLLDDPQFAPFIKAPPSKKFGHIEKMEVGPRGVAGTAKSISVVTNAGTWTISKELTIRSVFENPEVKLKRLKSARIFLDQTNDSLRLLKSLTISGFGTGHGVGLQQVGAHGLALKGLDYRAIIQHYYEGTTLGTL